MAEEKSSAYRQGMALYRMQITKLSMARKLVEEVARESKKFLPEDAIEGLDMTVELLGAIHKAMRNTDKAMVEMTNDGDFDKMLDTAEKHLCKMIDDEDPTDLLNFVDRSLGN